MALYNNQNWKQWILNTLIDFWQFWNTFRHFFDHIYNSSVLSRDSQKMPLAPKKYLIIHIWTLRFPLPKTSIAQLIKLLWCVALSILSIICFSIERKDTMEREKPLGTNDDKRKRDILIILDKYVPLTRMRDVGDLSYTQHIKDNVKITKVPVLWLWTKRHLCSNQFLFNSGFPRTHKLPKFNLTQTSLASTQPNPNLPKPTQNQPKLPGSNPTQPKINPNILGFNQNQT